MLGWSVLKFRWSATMSAHMGRLDRVRKSAMGICLTNLAGVQVECGELGEALAAAPEGLPLLKDLGLAWHQLDHLALRAALAGEVAIAGLLAGFTDGAHTPRKMSRGRNEARAHARLQTLLGEKFAPHQLERLLAEGTRMSEDEVCRVALQE